MKKLILFFSILLMSATLPAQESLQKKSTHYPSGKIKEEFTVDKDGRKQGTYTRYFENGVKEFEFMYKDNMKDGRCITRYRNGKISTETTYVNDKPKGSYTAWDEAGNLLEQATY